MKYFLFIMMLSLIMSAKASYAQFVSEEHYIRDLRNNLYWYRCSIGQRWDAPTKSCTGTLTKLNHEQIEEAIQQANSQLGGEWRLPTLKELESLICKECAAPKIRQEFFPNISREAYWTGTHNKWNSKMYWTVNFQTGFRYSRFFAYQELPVLIVQDP